jgi:hypothetical protein
MVAVIHEELIAVDVRMTVMGAPLSKSRTGGAAAERSSHSLHPRALKYIFRAAARDDFFISGNVRSARRRPPWPRPRSRARCSPGGNFLTLRSISSSWHGCCSSSSSPLAVARGGKACGVATPGSAACRDPRSARSQVSRPRASPTRRERKTEREYEACAFGWPVLALGLL